MDVSTSGKIAIGGKSNVGKVNINNGISKNFGDIYINKLSEGEIKHGILFEISTLEKDKRNEKKIV